MAAGLETLKICLSVDEMMVMNYVFDEQNWLSRKT